MPSPHEPIGDFAAGLNAGGDAWDCHVHLFGPAHLYPLCKDRRYTPQHTPLASLVTHAARVQVGHLVLVQASPYGNDNRCMLDALATFGAACRGVVSLATGEITDRSLSALHAAGVRGVRINPAGQTTTAEPLLRTFGELSERLSGSGWHIEINVAGEQAIALLIASIGSAVPVVFDHMFGLDPAHVAFPTSVSRIVELAGSDRIWMKVSGFERVCRTNDHRLALNDALMQLLETAPKRLLWGSDWPHTPFHDATDAGCFRSVDDRTERAALTAVLEPHADAVFISNPASLYR